MTEDTKTEKDKRAFTDEVLFSRLISKLGKDTFTYLPASVMPAFLGIVSVMIFTRVFMPSVYGQYSLVMAATGFLTSILSAWIQQSVARYLPKSRQEKSVSEFMYNLIAILLMVTFVFTLLSMFLYPFLAPALGVYERFYIPGFLVIITGFFFRNFQTTFQSNLQSKKYMKYNIIYAISQLSFAVIFVFLIAKDVTSLIIGTMASYAVLLGPMIKELGLSIHWRRLTQYLDISFLKRFAVYGFPMIGWFMGAQILAISDRFMIAVFKGSTQVGIYASNYGLVSRGIGLVSTPILMAAHPLIINAWESQNKLWIKEIIAAFSRYFLIVSIPLIAYVSVFSKELIAVLLGPDYQEGYVIIPIILAGSFAWNFAMYGHKGLELMEKTRLMLLLVIFCAGTNIALNLLFVPLYGYIGAAITTLISYLIYPLIVYRTVKPYINWQIPWRSVGNIIVSSLVVTGLLVMSKLFLAGKLNTVLFLSISGAMALPIYLLLLFALKEIKDFEIRYIKRKLAKLRIW